MGLHHNMAAEKEADKIGSKFMHSGNVISAMSSFYGKNLSESVHIHTDSAADSKTRSANRDAVASGNDIFFGRGILESNTPESKGLLAHEIVHTMQQSNEGGMEASVSYGAEQGGLLSFFKNLLGIHDNNEDFEGVWAQNAKVNNKADNNDPKLIYNNPADFSLYNLGPEYDKGVTDPVEKFLSVPKLGADINTGFNPYLNNNFTSKMGRGIMRGVTSTISGNLLNMGIGLFNDKSGTRWDNFKKRAQMLKRTWVYRLASLPVRFAYNAGKLLFADPAMMIASKVYESKALRSSNIGLQSEYMRKADRLAEIAKKHAGSMPRRMLRGLTSAMASLGFGTLIASIPGVGVVPGLALNGLGTVASTAMGALSSTGSIGQSIAAAMTAGVSHIGSVISAGSGAGALGTAGNVALNTVGLSSASAIITNKANQIENAIKQSQSPHSESGEYELDDDGNRVPVVRINSDESNKRASEKRKLKNDIQNENNTTQNTGSGKNEIYPSSVINAKYKKYLREREEEDNNNSLIKGSDAWKREQLESSDEEYDFGDNVEKDFWGDEKRTRVKPLEQDANDSFSEYDDDEEDEREIEELAQSGQQKMINNVTKASEDNKDKSEEKPDTSKLNQMAENIPDSVVEQMEKDEAKKKELEDSLNLKGSGSSLSFA